MQHFVPVQISDEEFLQCRGAVMDYLNKYGCQPSKLPRLRLVWSVSRRTLSKAKPSTRVLLDLETIMEDEVDGEETDDAGVFDSENDDGDLSRKAKLGMAMNEGGMAVMVQGDLSAGKGEELPEPNNNSKMATCPLQNKKCADMSFMLHSDDN